MSLAVSLDYPAFLLGLAALAPLLAADRLSARRRRIAESLPPGMRARFSGSAALFRLSMALLIAALAGPRWGAAPEQAQQRRSADVVFAIDVSRSMEVADGSGEYLPGAGQTRLDRGLEIAREAAEALPGARFAVAVSRGRGVLAVPLTWDSGAVASFLEALGGSAMTGRGTNLEALVDAAAGAFGPSPPARRAIVLISDGEETSGSLRAAADRSRQEGISIAALAVGSPGGGAVPGAPASAEPSRRDSGPMRMAAARTGGAYIDGSRQGAAAELISHLGALAMGAPSAPGPGGGAPGSAGPEGLRERWPLFAALSIAALGASKLCLLGKGPRRGSRRVGEEAGGAP